MSSDYGLRVQQLDDLPLAILLSLVAEQHCIIRTTSNRIEAVSSNIVQACRNVFGLKAKVVDCAEGLKLENFREGVLLDDSNNLSATTRTDDDVDERQGYFLLLDEWPVADVVVACNTNHASADVQAQILELFHSGRIFTRTAMHRTPKMFLFIALNSTASAPGMNTHLNDAFSICHVHEDPTDKRVELGKHSYDSLSSLASRNSDQSRLQDTKQSTTFSMDDVHTLQAARDEVSMTAEVETYMRNIIVAARLHRYVAGGISAAATLQFEPICRGLAVLHGLDYVTPALVDLAVRKTYLHRLLLADRQTERSIQWGSDPDAIEEAMKSVTVELALDSIIASVDTPL